MKKLILLFSVLFTLLPNLQAQEKWANYTSKNEVSAISIEGNKIWIGSNGGIQVQDLNGNILQEYIKDDGLADNKVRGIFIDKFENKWFATNNGVSKFDGTNWVTYNTTNSGIISNVIIDVFTLANLPDINVTGICLVAKSIVAIQQMPNMLYRTISTILVMLKMPMNTVHIKVQMLMLSIVPL